mgnify:FL=1|tara:strand:- start:231 stop:500 length:270 start_codon:yes stop_codon:yes gene_type:complete
MDFLFEVVSYLLIFAFFCIFCVGPVYLLVNYYIDTPTFISKLVVSLISLLVVYSLLWIISKESIIENIFEGLFDMIKNVLNKVAIKLNN